MRRAVTALVATALVVSACGSSPHSAQTVRVVASTAVWGSIATAIGGDYTQVRSIIDNPAEDPHSYDASPADAASIADADLVVYNGGGYDPFVDTVLAQHTGVKRVNAFSVGRHQPNSNPHVFYDLDTVSAVANAIADQLAAADPPHAAAYRAGAQTYATKLRDIADTERRISLTHPGAAVIATEDVAEYLAAGAGLADKTPQGYYNAVDADTDPAPADIATVLDLVNSHAVQLVLSNPQTRTSMTDRIVDAAAAARIPVVDVSETPPPNTDFLTWQRQTVDRLNASLQQIDNHTR